MRRVYRRPSPSMAVACLALFVALGGGAYAVSRVPDTNGIFHACEKVRTGTLRLVGSAKSCRKGERALAWNAKGQPGAPGISGKVGPQGSPGLQGPPGNPGAGIPFTLAEVDALDQSPTITSGDLAHPGPQVTITVPASGLVEVYVQADMSSSLTQGVIDLYEDGSPVSAWTGTCYFMATASGD